MLAAQAIDFGGGSISSGNGHAYSLLLSFRRPAPFFAAPPLDPLPREPDIQS